MRFYTSPRSMETIMAARLPAQYVIDSWDHFLSRGIQYVIQQLDPIEYDGTTISLKRVNIWRPRISMEGSSESHRLIPQECRLRLLTYQCMVRGIFMINNKEEEIMLCYLPCMIGSKFGNVDINDTNCPVLDPGDPMGYCIIKGSERVFIGHENTKFNTPCFFFRRFWQVEVASEFTASRLTIKLLKNGDVQFTLNRHTKNLYLPIETLFELLAGNPDHEADFYNIINWGGENRVQHVLCHYLLPHLGTTMADHAQKQYWLSAWVDELRQIALTTVATDRDGFAMKRVKIAGDHIEDLFRDCLYAFW